MRIYENAFDVDHINIAGTINNLGQPTIARANMRRQLYSMNEHCGSMRMHLVRIISIQLTQLRILDYFINLKDNYN